MQEKPMPIKESEGAFTKLGRDYLVIHATYVDRLISLLLDGKEITADDLMNACYELIRDYEQQRSILNPLASVPTTHNDIEMLDRWIEDPQNQALLLNYAIIQNLIGIKEATEAGRKFRDHMHYANNFFDELIEKKKKNNTV